MLSTLYAEANVVPRERSRESRRPDRVIGVVDQLAFHVRKLDGLSVNEHDGDIVAREDRRFKFRSRLIRNQLQDIRAATRVEHDSQCELRRADDPKRVVAIATFDAQMLDIDDEVKSFCRNENRIAIATVRDRCDRRIAEAAGGDQ